MRKMRILELNVIFRQEQIFSTTASSDLRPMPAIKTGDDTTVATCFMGKHTQKQCRPYLNGRPTPKFRLCIPKCNSL